MFLKCYLQEAGRRKKRKREHMRRLQAWQFLIGIFAVFWVIFAAVLIISAFPFYVISIALTTITMLSLLIIALAWAYQNNY
jgi:uncharacterized membrane protein